MWATSYQIGDGAMRNIMQSGPDQDGTGGAAALIVFMDQTEIGSRSHQKPHKGHEQTRMRKYARAVLKPPERAIHETERKTIQRNPYHKSILWAAVRYKHGVARYGKGNKVH